MTLESIYKPITDDLKKVDSLLASSIRESSNQSVLEMSNSLSGISSGKKLRPALVILSKKAASAGNGNGDVEMGGLITLATAVELIHLASLIHDDILDKATVRRGKPSVNTVLGNDISIVFGDYIYSKAFELIGKCRNPDIFECISRTIYNMCEGELIQICQRGNLNLPVDKYIAVVKKKTASLLATCCHAGAILGNHGQTVQTALKEFGMNFGIAFQIIDDCRDIVSGENTLGRKPGQDALTGDITLPLLNLLAIASGEEKKKIKTILASSPDSRDAETIRNMFIDSGAMETTRKTALDYVGMARSQLKGLESSDYKKSLYGLTDYIAESF
jgi:geranylgeranyl pyrophosphate synthase